ncbi:MAG: hypothetical protein R6U46_13505 [Marinilabilia sp.]
MIYKFRIISSENDKFIREVAIDSQATFLDLNNFLMEECGYEQSQMTSFFLTDRGWHKDTEITLIDMTDGQVPGIKVMDKTKIGELITEKKQRLLFVFDQFAERALFLELFEIKDGQAGMPQCIRRQGNPPPQFDKEALENGDIGDIDLGEILDDDEFPGHDDAGNDDVIDEEDLF